MIPRILLLIGLGVLFAAGLPQHRTRTMRKRLLPVPRIGSR